MAGAITVRPCNTKNGTVMEGPKRGEKLCWIRLDSYFATARGPRSLELGHSAWIMMVEAWVATVVVSNSIPSTKQLLYGRPVVSFGNSLHNSKLGPDPLGKTLVVQ